jgi:DNA-binding CsgD family transcriptional regulator
MIHDFIEATNNTKTSQELFVIFKKAMLNYGYDRAIFTLITDHQSLNKKACHGLFKSYPEDWMGYYTDHKYELLDPVIKHAAIAKSLFTWKELASSENKFTKKEKAVLYEAEDAKLLDGIAIPLFGSYGEIAGIGLASSYGNLKLNHHQFSTVNLLAYKFYISFLVIEQACPIPSVCLTHREKEILLWCTVGKSNSVIAEILDVSDHCINFHLRNIYKKLVVNSKIEAAIKAFRLGIISP